MKYCNLIGAATIVAVTRELSVIVTRPLRARWVWLCQTMAGWPADDIHVILKFNIDRNNLLLALFTKRTALLQLYQCV